MTLKILKTNNKKKEDWLLRAGTYELSVDDYRVFSKVWKHILSSSLPSSQGAYRTLLINDGSQLIYNSLSVPSDATIVDPIAYEYTSPEVSELINTSSFKKNKDSLNQSRSLLLIDESFEEAYDDCLFKNKYDLIFVNAQKPADLTVKTVENLFTVLEDFGCLFLQVPASVSDNEEYLKVEKALEHYFSYLSIRVRNSSSNISNSFIVYRKIQGLI